MKNKILIFVLLICAACDSATPPTVTPSPEPTATETPIPSDTPSPTITLTPSQTATASATATETETPTATLTPSQTPTPVNTPLPTPGLVFDNWEFANLPASLQNGLTSNRIVFLNQNNSETITNLSTAAPTTNREVLYFAAPGNPADRIAVLELTDETDSQVYLAPRGNAVAYFVDAFGADIRGLYIMDINTGISGRVLAVDSLTQRGIFSAPAWTSDGQFLAVTIENGYSLDIVAFDVSNSTWRSLVQSGAFDFWPSWSPDGRFLAFVSDRATCPTWNPNQPNACTSDITPAGGNLYLLERATGEITQISDQMIYEPPYWINNRQIAFSVGDPFDLLNQSRSLWIATVEDRAAREVPLLAGPANQFNVAENWTDDGSRAVFQSITSDGNTVVVMNASGQLVTTIDDVSFARFSLSADWSPDGTRLVLGGSGGQCPYGIRVLNEDFEFVARGNQPGNVCDPVFSPSGQFIAFTGVNASIGDGRVDIYSSSFNGFSVTNLTGDLRGEKTLLGWVGPDQ